MNIFVLDKDPRVCATYHCDKHVIKMILESAQILSTVCRLEGYDVGYKSTHVNHPCTVWTRVSINNWLWLRSLARCLDAEYRFRWTKAESHKSYLVIQDLPVPELLPRIGVTKFVTAMPAACILDDPIASYRNYYIREKASLAKWTRTRVPAWFIEGLRKVNAGLIPNLSPSDDEVIVNTFSKLDKPVYDYVDPFADLDKSNEDFSYF